MERKEAWVAGAWDHCKELEEQEWRVTVTWCLWNPVTQNCSSRLLLNDSDWSGQLSIVRLPIVIFETGQLLG